MKMVNPSACDSWADFALAHFTDEEKECHKLVGCEQLGITSNITHITYDLRFSNGSWEASPYKTMTAEQFGRKLQENFRGTVATFLELVLKDELVVA